MSRALQGDGAVYAQLRKQVGETLLRGQRRIEEAKVQIYWRTGSLIQEHLISSTDRSPLYGKRVIRNLSADLHVSPSVLWRCLRFAQTFKIVAARPLSSFPRLTWTHYRQLICIPDQEIRLSLMRRAENSEWTADELARKIQQEVSIASRGNGTTRPAKLLPKRGVLYIYRLIAPDTVHHKEDAPRLWMDLGFQVHRQLPPGVQGFKEGALIESRWDPTGYTVHATNRTLSDLYTYQAYVERVVDGDTLLVKISLGFETRIRHYLRLRGVDAPDLDTAEGKKARAFVERVLAKVDHVILTSSRADKYGRYLADVFYVEDGKKDEVFLNQRLLNQNLAVRV